MNKVVSYQSDKHQEQLKDWYVQWGMSPKVLDILPSTGLIIEGKCSVFLYETNSSTCFIDGFISNKNIDKDERDKCLDLIVKTALHLAKEKGFKYMKGDSQYQAVVDRAINFGFTLSPNTYKAFFKELI